MLRFLRPAAAGLTTVAALLLLGCAADDSPPGEAVPGAATGLPATESAPLPEPGGDLRTEYASLQQRLNGLQQQAMQDSALAAEYQALESLMEARMTAADPELDTHRTRLMELQQEMGAAQQAGDQEKMQTLLEEGTAIQTTLQGAQQEAMASEGVDEKMTAFRDHVMEKMTELDENAQAMVDRANEIGAILSGTAPPPAGPAPEGATGE